MHAQIVGALQRDPEHLRQIPRFRRPDVEVADGHAKARVVRQLAKSPRCQRVPD